MPQEFWTNRQLELLVTGPAQAERILLAQPYALIGSDPSCDVVLPDDRLPARCYVALLTDAGLVGTSLVRRSTARFQPVCGERGIRAGRFRIHFRIASPSARDLDPSDSPADDELPACPSQGLVRWQTDGRRKFARLRAGKPLLLGRRPPSRLCLDDRGVSSTHGVVFLNGQRLWLIDLSSTNGTYVNDRPIHCDVLPPGESFVVGSTALQYELRQELADEQPGSEANQDEADQLAQRQQQLQQQAEAALREQAAWQQQFEQLQHQLDAARAEHEQQVEQWRQQYATERDAWEQQRQADREQLDQRRAEFERDRQAAWVAIDGQRAELQQQRTQLDHDRQTLQAEYEQLQGQREDLTARLHELDQERQKLTALREQQHAAVARANELLLVRRIRVQRDLQRREAELAEREAELHQREQALCETPAPAQQSGTLNRRRRTIPLPPGVGEAGSRTPQESTCGSSAAPVQGFELANPLLESADFTDLLKHVLDDVDPDGSAI